MSSNCPNCGCSGRNDRWQSSYTCGTVYPFDGPHRRGEACLAIEDARKERDKYMAMLDDATGSTRDIQSHAEDDAEGGAS